MTTELLRNMIGSCRFDTARHLMVRIREVGLLLVESEPTEFAIGNIVRRVLYIVREECVKIS